MSELNWPPTEEKLAWRPPAEPPTDLLSSSVLVHEGEDLPDWVALPDDVKSAENGEVEIPAYALAHVETDAGRPGGGGFSTIWAVPTTDGDLRIVIWNDDEVPFESPIERLPALPALGELLRVLDETRVGGETFGVGHPTREYNDIGDRDELRGFVTISSGLYPQLEALDQSRLEQWIAERP